VSIESESAVAELDAVLDRAELSPQLADELFAVVDLLQGSPTLRRAMTDPATPTERRQALARGLLQSRVGGATVELVAEAVGKRLGGGALLDALERQAVRALLKVADSQGRLDDVEDQLFRFGRVVEGDAALRGAITDRTSSLERREALVDQLLAGKAQPETVRLSRRAVAARDRNFARTLNGYVQQAAQMRDRLIAVVRVARPLEPQQWQRLQQALSRQAGREVALQEVVEPQLLGGARVEFGDEVIEGTVAGRLEAVRRQFG
jgi:F-type H+-transporting ATPase subunit delta